MLTPRFERGDTIIEVLFAVTVFSLIVVSALSIMNQGTAISQRSLEITQVRQQVDSQAETLRFLHDSYVQSYYSGITYDLTDLNTTGGLNTTPSEEYYKIIRQVRLYGETSASQFGTVACDTPPDGSFILNSKLGTLTTASTIFQYPDVYAKVVYDASSLITASQGIWIEGVRSGTSADANQANTGYIDFHIRGCWDGPGTDLPMNIGTIVRLYEPRG
jgi:type II secretory pathway pseudopilin PulG